MKKKTKNKKSKNKSLVLAASKVAAKPYYITVVALWCVYLAFTFIAPNNTASTQMQLSDQALNLIRLTVAIPYLLIWLAATYSFIKIKRYAMGIRPSREASAYDNIALGVFFLLISLILSVLVGSLRTFLVDYTHLRPMLTILTNYTYVVPYFFAFAFLLHGTNKLALQKQSLTISLTKNILLGLFLTGFAYLWLELIFSNPSRVTPGTASKFASYYINDSLLVLTIVIPSLITWLIGLRTILKLWIYRNLVKGTIYKRALSSFVYGLTGVIIGSIIIQALLSLGAQRILVLGLSGVLQVIYVFVLIQIIGFLLVARGAQKLTKIEEV